MLMVRKGLLGLVLVAVAVWAADWAVWKARGAPSGTITVTRVVVAPLKNHREEYYPDGTVEVRCSRSGLPEGAANPCWWVGRNRVVWDR